MPKNQKNQTIEEILKNLDSTQQETIQRLRSLVKSTVPETVEIVRQGKISYRLGENDFAWISPFQNHVDLEFAMGASLASSKLKSRGPLERNENVRHIEVSNFDKQQQELTRLLGKAAILGFSHCPTK